jgi:hypothetical protein
MAAVAGPRFCAEGPWLMSKKPKRAPRSPELTASLETSLRRRPQRAGCCAPTQSKSRPYGAYGSAARSSCGLSMFM